MCHASRVKGKKLTLLRTGGLSFYCGGGTRGGPLKALLDSKDLSGRDIC
jgi:hypothetical protein